MIDWLLRGPDQPLTVEVAGRELPLVLRRLSTARRMTLRLAPDGSEARMTLPRWGRTAEALAFARSRAGWLAGQLAALPQVEAPGHGTHLPYLGEAHLLHHDPQRPRRVTLDQGRIHIGGPTESLSPRLQRWLEGEARRLLAGDLAHYCERAGQAVPSLALSRAQRRWGSCARNGAIRINWRLIMAPPAVRRSVVAHEVAHLVHFDHSPAFHAFLAEIYDGDLREADRWLRREGRALYRLFG